jgi:hypothetical protein
MRSGLNSLNLSLMSSNTKRAKKTWSRMLYPAKIPPFSLALTHIFWVWMSYRICTLLILSLEPYLNNAQTPEGSMISICMTVSFLRLTNYVFPSPLFVCCYCKRHMVEDSWDISDVRRLMPCFQHTTFGQECTATSRGTSNDALHAYKLSPKLIPLVSICLYLSHMHHGRTLAWISSWVCHVHEMVMTQYLWS